MSPEPLPAHIAAIERPSPPLWTYYVLQAIASTVAFPVTIVLLYFRYHTMRYRFDAEGIHMRWGILMRREVMLNYSRIQDIQLRANFVERWLGLARIEIQTASGSAGAQMTLEGLLTSSRSATSCTRACAGRGTSARRRRRWGRTNRWPGC